jgi:hypothetical protein
MIATLRPQLLQTMLSVVVLLALQVEVPAVA